MHNNNSYFRVHSPRPAFPIASFHIRPQEFYYRKIRYERHDVASGGASGTKFCMAVNGKNAGSERPKGTSHPSTTYTAEKLPSRRCEQCTFGENESAFD